jgi:hypothetical protein
VTSRANKSLRVWQENSLQLDVYERVGRLVIGPDSYLPRTSNLRVSGSNPFERANFSSNINI